MRNNSIKLTPRKSISLLVVSVLFFFTGSLIDCKVANSETLLFPEIKAWDLKSLRITDKNNRVLDFKRKMCVWTLGEEALATNEVRVTDLADQVIGLVYQKYIPSQESLYADYMVDDNSFNYRVDFGLPDGEVKRIYLGTDNNSNVLYARPFDDEKIYVLSKVSIKNITMEREYWLPDNK